MTEALSVALKRKMKELSIVPYADGRFEVFVDDERIWSKLDCGEFPDPSALAAKLT